jgi:hypothetical protein
LRILKPLRRLVFLLFRIRESTVPVGVTLRHCLRLAAGPAAFKLRVKLTEAQACQ